MMCHLPIFGHLYALLVFHMGNRYARTGLSVKKDNRNEMPLGPISEHQEALEREP